MIGGTDRERPSRDGGVHLDDEQEQVDSEGCVDSELDLRLIPDIFFDLVRLLILGPEKLVDEFILPCVVFFDLLLVPRWVVRLYLLGGSILTLELPVVQRIAP